MPSAHRRPPRRYFRRGIYLSPTKKTVLSQAKLKRRGFYDIRRDTVLCWIVENRIEFAVYENLDRNVPAPETRFSRRSTRARHPGVGRLGPPVCAAFLVGPYSRARRDLLGKSEVNGRERILFGTVSRNDTAVEDHRLSDAQWSWSAAVIDTICITLVGIIKSPSGDGGGTSVCRKANRLRRRRRVDDKSNSFNRYLVKPGIKSLL